MQCNKLFLSPDTRLYTVMEKPKKESESPAKYIKSIVAASAQCRIYYYSMRTFDLMGILDLTEVKFCFPPGLTLRKGPCLESIIERHCLHSLHLLHCCVFHACSSKQVAKVRKNQATEEWNAVNTYIQQLNVGDESKKARKELQKRDFLAMLLLSPTIHPTTSFNLNSALLLALLRTQERPPLHCSSKGGLPQAPSLSPSRVRVCRLRACQEGAQDLHRRKGAQENTYRTVRTHMNYTGIVLTDIPGLTVDVSKLKNHIWSQIGLDLQRKRKKSPLNP